MALSVEFEYFGGVDDTLVAYLTKMEVGIIFEGDTVTSGMDVEYDEDNKLILLDVFFASRHLGGNQASFRYDSESDVLTICFNGDGNTTMMDTDDPRIRVGVRADGTWDTIDILSASSAIRRRMV
jgi:uncharacterized protein YuzE